MMLRAAAGGGGGGGSLLHTWDPAKVHANITLSNGNRFATKSSFDALKSVLGLQGRAHTDKRYFEVTVEAGGVSPFMVVGLGGASADLTTACGVGTDSWGYYQDTGEKHHNNALTAYGSAWASTGDIIGVAMDNGKVWFSKLNTWQGGGDPAAGTGEAFSGLTGTLYPMASLYRQTAPAHVLRIRTRPVDHVYAPPSGFSAWADNAGSGWSTTDKHADVTVSGGGDYRATVVSAGSSVGNVRGAQSRNASDNRAFELIMFYTDGGGAARGMAGVGNASAELNNYPGYDAHGYGIWANSGNLYHNNPSGSGTSLLTGPIVSGYDILTFHLNAGTLKVAKNGGAQSTIAGSLTGDWYPMWGPGSSAAGTRACALITRGLTHLPAGSTAWG